MQMAPCCSLQATVFSDGKFCTEDFMVKKALVLLADGFEEVEAITPIDYMRRAGIEVTVAAVGSGERLLINGSHNIQVSACAAMESLAAEGKLAPGDWDAVIVPGGLPGADNLASSAEAGTFIKSMAAAGKLVASICASPARVLSPLGLLTGKKFTCYPGQEERVFQAGSASPGAQLSQERVVIDGNVITSRGAGTAGEFSCAIIAYLTSEDEAKKLAEKLLLFGMV